MSRPVVFGQQSWVYSKIQKRPMKFKSPKTSDCDHALSVDRGESGAVLNRTKELVAVKNVCSFGNSPTD